MSINLTADGPCAFVKFCDTGHKKRVLLSEISNFDAKTFSRNKKYFIEREGATAQCVVSFFATLDKLGFSDYHAEAEAVLKDCKAVAAKRRRQSTRLENLGIPEEELLRQQQELFAKARQEQAFAEQQQWEQLQAAAQQAQASVLSTNDDQDDYS